MHELAPLTMPSFPVAGWEGAPIPSTMLSGYEVLHVKGRPDRESALIGMLGFPSSLQVSSLGPLEACWMGPAEWLLLASTGFLHDLDKMEDVLRVERVPSVRCGSRLQILDFGPVISLFRDLTGLPGAALAPGRTARTRLADVPVTLAVRGDGRIRLFFERIHAPHLRTWLERAT